MRTTVFTRICFVPSSRNLPPKHNQLVLVVIAAELPFDSFSLQNAYSPFCTNILKVLSCWGCLGTGGVRREVTTLSLELELAPLLTHLILVVRIEVMILRNSFSLFIYKATLERLLLSGQVLCYRITRMRLAPDCLALYSSTGRSGTPLHLAWL